MTLSDIAVKPKWRLEGGFEGRYDDAVLVVRAVSRYLRCVTEHPQPCIESDPLQVERRMPRGGGVHAFNTARRTICGFEAMLWLRKRFGFAGAWTLRD